MNRDGEEITRNRAVLDCVGEDLAGHLLTMVQAAQLTLPVLAVSEAQAADLRFGRRIVAQAPTDDERPAHHHGEHVWAAIGSADGEPEVVAIVEQRETPRIQAGNGVRCEYGKRIEDIWIFFV